MAFHRSPLQLFRCSYIGKQINTNPVTHIHSFCSLSDKFERHSYYVDTGYMYIEQDLSTGQVRDVTSSYIENQNAVEYPNQKQLAITNGSRPASVIVTKNEPPPPTPHNTNVVGQTVVMPKKEGSVIISRKEGSVIMPKQEGHVIINKREGSVIIPRREMSIINESVVRGSVVGYPQERIIQRVVTSPREHRIIKAPRGRIVTTQRERPQTVRVIRRSNGYAPSVRGIPEGRMAYVMDDSYVPGRYATRRVLVRNGDIDNDYDNNIHRLYKTTINVPSSESDSSDSPKEVVKTRYISSPSNRFKNVKGVPAAKMYVPTSNVRPSKDSNSDSDTSSLDSVDIKTFEKGVKKTRKLDKKKK